MKGCLFAGTFDPITLGHYHTVIKLKEKYDKIIVAVGVNPEKTPFFPLADRLAFLKQAFKGVDNVEIDSYSGVTVEYMQKKNLNVLVRGIRNSTDLEYEKKNEMLSKQIYPQLITEYIYSDADEKNLSSTYVRDLIKNNQPFGEYLPKGVEELIKKSLAKLKKNKLN